MKRTTNSILFGLLGLSIAILGAGVAVSCGGDDDAEPAKATSTQPAPTVIPEATSTPTKAPAKLGEAQVGSISITNASVRETANDVTAMYMTIKTTGIGDRLVSATTAISPKVQLHETVMVSGAMQMQEVAGGIAVPPAGEVVLKPGGLHVMFMNLTAPLKAEQTVTIELMFEKAGKVTLTAPVKPIGDTTGAMGGGSPPAMGTKSP
ncbi:MAG: copper chaperone PCu(A)C [Anaerolineaceae bacterium]